MNENDEAKALQNMKYNPKSFFIFAKTRQKTRPRIGPFLDLSTCQPNPNPNFAASLLSDQYKSVFVQPRQDWLVDNVKDFFTHSGGGSVYFTEMDEEAACAELSTSSAAGADEVPAACSIGPIPPDLLLVIVSPVHRGGSRGTAKNYRPVSLTSHLIKVFEQFLRKVLVSHH